MRSGLPLAMLLLVVLLGVGVQDGAAQHASVRGFVTDSTTEQSMQRATVVLHHAAGTTYGAATDGDGYFILRRIPPGRYVLTISFIGYAPYTEDLTLAAGEAAQRQIALGPQETELDEVVVQAEGETGVTAVAAGLQSVVPAQIERVPMPGVSGDLASYLQTVPGVVVQGDRGGLFFVRGGSLDQNLALLDGLPVYMPFHILSFYSAFPQEIIDNADLYTGGFGARYGTRISSVVDVQARKGNKQKLAGEFSLAPFLSTARLEGPVIKDKVSLIGSVRQSFIEEIMPDLFGQRLPYRFGDRFGKLHAFLSTNHSFSLIAMHTFDRGDLAGTEKSFQGDAVATAINDSSEVAWENLVLGGRYVYLSNFLPLLVEVTAGHSAMTNEFGPPEARERTSDVRSFDVAAHFTYFIQQREIRFGVSGRRSTYAFELGGQFQDLESDEQRLTEVNAYVETDLTFADAKLRVQPGLHFYALPNRSRQWVEPRLRATWRPGGLSGRHQIHVAGGLYRQTVVGLNDERDVGNIFTAWIPTPEDAPVPEAMHVIAGWNMRVTPWLSVAAEAFYK
ncbi:MAG: carboxypeptidase regulatory-like domain-containing protein, partial [Rhodothermales bacterium]